MTRTFDSSRFKPFHPRGLKAQRLYGLVCNTGFGRLQWLAQHKAVGEGIVLVAVGSASFFCLAGDTYGGMLAGHLR